MTDLAFATIDTAVAQLFRASECSLDTATADFSLHRTIPITIYIDGEYEGLAEVADDLKGEIARLMADIGYPQVGEWGPSYGSYFAILFGRGSKPESGNSVLRHLKDLSGRLLALKDRIPPGARETIRFVLVVGPYVVHVFGGAAALAAVLPVAVPIAAIECVVLAAETGAVAIEMSALLGLEHNRLEIPDKTEGKRRLSRKGQDFDF
jgi:hypothetical protein